ncbi:hypothetical protein A4A49_32655 [Nicotiana attenuata]|uniref:Uncharacterized protein n=1 Tax=Nicotiana attenuata TaxID=49451 RepID=A0A314LD44_NICAT|nr:hypothetical protein A4A49_32655 [Nicotiana attenuata]
MAINGSIEQPQPSVANQRYTFNPQPAAADLQHHPILTRPNSTRPICDTPVHCPTTMTPTGPVIFNVRETTLPTTGEHLERDNQSPIDIEKLRNVQGEGATELLQPNENRFLMARGSKSNGIQRGLQRDVDPTFSQNSCKMLIEHALSLESGNAETTLDPNSSDESPGTIN